MKSYTLCELCSIHYGKDHRYLEDGDIPAFGSGGLMRKVNKAIYTGPSVLIPRKGSLSNLFYVDDPFWTVDTLFWTKINQTLVIPKYLYYILGSQNLASLNEGSAVPSLTVKTLSELVLQIPPLNQQRKIVSLLEPLETKINVNRQINDNLEQLAESYFQKLFIDNACSDWTLGTISDLGTVVGGGTPSKSKPEYYTTNGIGWVTPKDLSISKSKFISHGANDITELGLKNSSACVMPEGTVLFSSRAPIGYIAIASGKVTTNQGFKSVVPKPEIGTAFVYYFLKHNLPIIEGMASGSTFKEVSGSIMRNVPVVIPDAEILAKFGEFCDSIFVQQKILEEQNQSLASLRDVLLHKSMSGTLDVSKLNI